MYDKKDIMLDYFICNTTFTALSFLDIFPHDGHVDDFDRALNIQQLASGELSVANLKSLAQDIKNDPEMLNEALDAIVTNFEDSREMVAELIAQESGNDIQINDSAMTAAIDSLKGSIDFYRYEPGIDQDGDNFDCDDDGIQDPTILDSSLTALASPEILDGSMMPITRDRVVAGLRPPTGEWLSGDWGVDEEEIDGKDNDGDGITDEDFHLPR
jgi:hypothetical protein